MTRTRAETEALIERNQEAYAEGWLQPDQFAYNMAALSAEMDNHDAGVSDDVLTYSDAYRMTYG